jgi:uncharacterized membrane protein
MKTLGIVLIILGILAFLYTGFTYTKKEKVVDVGPLEVSADKQKTVSWPPIVGIVLVIGGVVAVVADRRK